MTRKRRIQYENACYHVMNRGSGRRQIFRNNEDKQLFLELLSEVHKTYHVEIHAYCLMDNHYHLLVCTPLANLADVMRYLQGVYTKKINILLNTDGPIFRGRYKAILVDTESYLLQVCRYIHLNPVKANVNDGLYYSWSSYKHYINIRKESPLWLNTKIILDLFDESPVRKFTIYHHENDVQELLNFYNSENHFGHSILGNEQFKDNATVLINSTKLKTEEKLNLEIKVLAGGVLEYFQISLNELAGVKPGRFNLPRLIFCFIAKEIYGYASGIIAKYLGASSSAKAVSNLLDRQKKILTKEFIDELQYLKGNHSLLIERIANKFDDSIL